MFGKTTKGALEAERQNDYRAHALAVNKSHAVIEFDIDGTIRTANENFLRTMGYTLDEVVGKKHRTFVDPLYAESAEYADFWQRLNRGEHQTGEFKRLGKDGRVVWWQASYDPIFDAGGKPCKVIKLASDVTLLKQKNAEFESEVVAIDRSTGVVHLGLDGTIVEVNDNFLKVVGYARAELCGRHHSILVEKEYAKSADYRQFWNELRSGAFVTGQFKRIGKDGQPVWLEASYNPILDPDGQPLRIVKFAADITEQRNTNIEFRGEVEAINRLQAVIHFKPDSTITWANQKYLDAVGYTLAEIVGKQHSMFVETAQRQSAAYLALWSDLRAGIPTSAQFHRIGKGGKPIRLNATYTPIIDEDGRTFKVVKFATNITDEVQRQSKQEEIVQVTFDNILEAVASVGEQSELAACASQKTAVTVNAVAASTERLDASIGDIGKSMTASRSAVDRAMSETVAADESTRRLSTKITLMSEIVALIQKVAEHINLLSLNASIEAARAGSAGRGFSVVAGEVKSLAGQVASASAKITQEINDIQVTSCEVVSALAAINRAVESVQASIADTAAVVKEQTSVTSTISSNMRSASSSVVSINASLGGILELVAAASASAREGKDTLDSVVTR